MGVSLSVFTQILIIHLNMDGRATNNELLLRIFFKKISNFLNNVLSPNTDG